MRGSAGEGWIADRAGEECKHAGALRRSVRRCKGLLRRARWPAAWLAAVQEATNLLMARIV